MGVRDRHEGGRDVAPTPVALEGAMRRVERYRRRVGRTITTEDGRSYVDVREQTRRVWAAEESARQLVREARRQAALIEEEAEAQARAVRAARLEVPTALRIGAVKTADRVERVAAEAAATHGRWDSARRGFEDALADLSLVAPPPPVFAEPTAIAAAPGAPSALRAVAFGVLYWTAVVVVSLALVVALVLFLESRDLSSLSTE